MKGTTVVAAKKAAAEDTSDPRSKPKAKAKKSTSKPAAAEKVADPKATSRKGGVKRKADDMEAHQPAEKRRAKSRSREVPSSSLVLEAEDGNEDAPSTSAPTDNSARIQLLLELVDKL